MVPGAGIEPARRFRARDFKSLVSTCSTIRAEWRRGSESNRRPRLCRPLHNHSATPPGVLDATSAEISWKLQIQLKLKGEIWKLPRCSGAGNETRTRDLYLGKVSLYQLSYSRVNEMRIVMVEGFLSSAITRLD